MKSISVVINARTQSTRVPNKLCREFAGTCLLDIALEKLNRMSFFEKRYLAVAEEALSIKVKDYESVEVLRRSEAAVKKGVNPLHVTFEHYLHVPTDYVFVFNPCLPCIKVETIKAAWDYFQKTNYNSYTAVVKTGDWIFSPDGVPLTINDPKNVTTNANTSFYKGCHAFNIINKNFFKEHNILWRFEKNDPHVVEIPIDEAVDVDTMEEFEVAEKLYLQKGSK